MAPAGRLNSGFAITISSEYHGPAARGETAPVVIDVGYGIAGKSGKITGMVMLSEEEEAELTAGLWYLNIHSVDVPSGELRGQLVEMSPLDSAAVYDAEDGKLELESVMVPGLGVFEAELKIVADRVILSFELDDVHIKDLDDDDSEDDDSSDDGTSDDGTSDDGTSDDGTSDDGTSDDGTSDDGTSDDGSSDDGSSDDSRVRSVSDIIY